MTPLILSNANLDCRICLKGVARNSLLTFLASDLSHPPHIDIRPHMMSRTVTIYL